MKTYKAPWSISLIVVSSIVTAVCLGVAIHLFSSGRACEALVPLAIIFGGLIFTIHGYTITPDAILVHRLFWVTRLPLSGLQSAEVAPDIMRSGIRLCGNGGLFSFAGWFRNKALGVYRSFVTDPHRTVVLRFAKRPVVVSPSSPEDFVHDIHTYRQAP
jgi:hypothetical protein